jgi:hypothetical protein
MKIAGLRWCCVVVSREDGCGEISRSQVLFGMFTCDRKPCGALRWRSTHPKDLEGISNFLKIDLPIASWEVSAAHDQTTW